MLYITKCNTLEKGPYGTIYNFRLWASKVKTGASGQNWVFTLVWFFEELPYIGYPNHSYK